MAQQIKERDPTVGEKRGPAALMPVRPTTAMVAYRPGPGDPDSVVAFGGRRFVAGQFVEVPETIGNYPLLDKLWGNPFFEVQGERTYGDDPLERMATGVDPEALGRASEARQGERETDAEERERRGEGVILGERAFPGDTADA